MLLLLLFITLCYTKDILCCYYSEHYHNCYESINNKGCIIGPSIFLESLNNKGQPYFTLCSENMECPPTELGGVFLRGFRKNCPECKK